MLLSSRSETTPAPQPQRRSSRQTPKAKKYVEPESDDETLEEVVEEEEGETSTVKSGKRPSTSSGANSSGEEVEEDLIPSEDE